MYKGLLRVSGTIDLSQFWPGSGSDADTASAVVNSQSFEFAPDATVPLFRSTRVFEGAEIRGTKVIHSGKVTIRLQGVDAPELHFAALISKKNLTANGTKFRQLLGETATVELRAALPKRPSTLSCEVLSRIDKPGDAFDVYGRLVGDVLIPTKTQRLSLAHWLAESGWALPSYYNSMLPVEIRALQKLVAAARAKRRGVWKVLEQVVGPPDLKLVFRPHGRFSAKERKADRGRVVVPKFFRRRIRYAVLDLNGQAPTSFKEYLKSDKSPWVTLEAFLANPEIKKPKNSLATLLTETDRVTKRPDQVVFFEAPGTLKKNGKPVTQWTFV